MNIETKTVRRGAEAYLKFGWKHTEDIKVRHGKSHHIEHVLARDKDMPNYDKIVSLERKYFSLKSRLKSYEPMDPLWGTLAFLCFIIPFVIYVIIKNEQKKSTEEYNAKILREMNGVLTEVQKL